MSTDEKEERPGDGGEPEVGHLPVDGARLVFASIFCAAVLFAQGGDSEGKVLDALRDARGTQSRLDAIDSVTQGGLQSRAIAVALGHLLEADDKVTRAHAADALAKQDRWAIPVLQKALSGSTEARMQALRVLGTFRELPESIVADAGRALGDCHEDPRVRAQALAQLRQLEA